MSINQVGTGCADCIDNACTMNCSSAVIASGSEWIAASIAAGVFPAKATAEQVTAHRNTASPPNALLPTEESEAFDDYLFRHQRAKDSEVVDLRDPCLTFGVLRAMRALAKPDEGVK